MVLVRRMGRPVPLVVRPATGKRISAEVGDVKRMPSRARSPDGCGITGESLVKLLPTE